MISHQCGREGNPCYNNSSQPADITNLKEVTVFLFHNRNRLPENNLGVQQFSSVTNHDLLEDSGYVRTYLTPQYYSI